VLRNGNQLTLIDPMGQISAGTVTGGTQIVATDWNNLQGTFDQVAGTISFADGTLWQSMRQIDGRLFTGTNLVAGVQQLGTDLVFTGGQSLWEAKKDKHPSVHAFPSSVDIKHFETARAGLDDPEDQDGIPRPRIGWCGVIDERMNIELLVEVATAHPEWHFVMIGPIVKIDPASLPKKTRPEATVGWECISLAFGSPKAHFNFKAGTCAAVSPASAAVWNRAF